MSPILVRPVREQLEHDRVIRLLQAKYKRKFEVAINPGNEQTMPAGNGPSPWYPDLVLQTSDRARKLAGVVEVETVESVNHLEAMSQWVSFGRLRVPFHLYLPTAAIDTGRRFCTELGIPVAELWAYQLVGDQLRFTLVQRTGPALEGKSRAVSEAPISEPAKRAAAPRAAPEARAAKTPARTGAPPARTAAAATRTRSGSGGPASASASTASTSRRAAAAPPAAPAPRRPAAKAKSAAPPRRPAAAKAAAPRAKVKTAAPASRPQKRR